MKNYFILPIVLITLLLSCSKNAQRLDEKTNDEASLLLTSVDKRNTQQSFNFYGVYRGVLPCADCSGIETSVELNEGGYVRTSTYLDKDSGSFVERGSFSWDEDSKIVTLSNVLDGPVKYIVEDKCLIQLDINGKKITGKLADKYILNKG